MNRAEKEQYLREYALLKSKGKPFFPYAVAKDSIMACIVMLTIILMSIIFGAELGPKADPTTTTYVPRPEWYFFFLFELLRVIKPAVLVPVATIGIPTVCLILLIALPFIDRGPERRPERRPIATLTGIFVICAMGYLTYLGAAAGSPNSIDMAVQPQFEAGKEVAAQSGCLACHKIGENGNDGPGPHLTDIGDKLDRGAIRRTLENPTAPMPSFAGMPADKKTALVNFLASLKSGTPERGVQSTGSGNPESAK
jgi:menaquinol-cytochrome c reductase cytochrome b/c subunit